jgi:hypothetical protein
MPEKKDEKPRAMPKGGRKGGTSFPRLSLTEALTFSENVTRKTHTGSQSVENIRVGVFGSKGPRGGIKAAALKQYGLLDEKDGTYNATPLAREIDAAPQEERSPLWRRAFLTSKIFAQMYETYQGDEVSRPKLRQLAITKVVHADNADECVDNFISGALKCGLASGEHEDRVTLVAKNTSEPTPEPRDGEEEEVPQELAGGNNPTPTPGPAKPEPHPKAGETSTDDPPARGKVQVNLNLHVDSSTDPETLRKQLEYLEKFGVI